MIKGYIHITFYFNISIFELKNLNMNVEIPVDGLI